MRIHRSFRNIGMSKIVQVSEKAKVWAPTFEKESKLPFIYFQRGEVGYPTPSFLVDGFREAIEKGHTKYPKPGGEDYFKEAVLSDLYENYDVKGLKHENVVAVYGGQEGLELVFAAFRGRTVAGFTPCWSCMFDNIIPYTESNFISVPLIESDNWGIPWKKLEEVLPNCELFYFNSPHNPTGKVFSQDEVVRLTNLCEKYGVTLVSDEAYKGLIYGENRRTFDHYSPLNTGHKNVVSVNTFSKVFAATGFRIGFVASPREDLIAHITGGNYTETAGVSSPTQYAFAKALRHPGREAWEYEYWREMTKRRAALADNLSPTLNANKPDGAFYAFIKVADPDNEAFVVNMLMQNGIAVVPGSAFGADFAGYVRLSFSTLKTDLIETGATRFNSVVTKINAGKNICEQPLC